MTEYNAANRKDVQKALKESRQKDVRKAETITAIMSTPGGREWMHDLLETCNIGREPFTGDALTTAHACGMMNIGLRIWADLQNICPDQYIQMMREANDRSNASNTRNSGPADGAGPDPADGSED